MQGLKLWKITYDNGTEFCKLADLIKDLFCTLRNSLVLSACLKQLVVTSALIEHTIEEV